VQPGTFSAMKSFSNDWWMDEDQSIRTNPPGSAPMGGEGSLFFRFDSERNSRQKR
jgi:hypothetical protein